MLGNKRGNSVFATENHQQIVTTRTEADNNIQALEPMEKETVKEESVPDEMVSVESRASDLIIPAQKQKEVGELGTGNRTHSLFFAPESEGRDFSSVLKDVQEHISSNYSQLITNDDLQDAKEQMKRYIGKYVMDERIAVKGMDGGELVDALYTEMAEYGFLTKYIFGKGIEEIDGATRS
ncbi:hypothetical protein [Anaerotignum propionicum]|uniref:Pilus assembly protein CpaF n=1 Tax=Anaerotignum propionicum DSM 1682 TaxID=991789 RepID=A0A0X1U9C4_ANAPI|nr:hypothetical protein [Anaerotignum propionicum]AMJ41538.1 hypothetical protein CPRO_19560 [Anaerotignum propionicum DSM 1682]SHE70879.1 pilus assembly protein CpaF [[Clostridium] propionicum DSM 1682] [Anaerotignum propionicum DSM 1682]